MKTWKLVNYDTNKGYEQEMFSHAEPFWVCLSYVLLYVLGLMIITVYKRLEYGYLIIRGICGFLVISIVSIELIGYFYFKDEINKNNLFFALVLFLFMITCKNDLCWKAILGKAKNT